MALPKEPRQKMINIMYLVLTALLALNVSSEILNAFKTVRRSLENTNTTVTASTTTIMKSLEDKTKEEATKERALKWFPIAQNAQSISKTAYDYIENLKNQIITKAGGKPGDPSVSFKEDNLDIVTKMMVTDKEGDKLMAILKKFNSDLIKIDPEIDSAFAGSNFVDLSNPPGRDGKVKPWDVAYFHMVPTVAGLTILSKFQNDIKTAENKVITECHKKVGEVKVVFDTYKAIIGQSSNYLMPGQELEVRAGVGAFSKTAQPSINIGGSSVSLGEEGYATYKTQVSGSGKHTIPVRISYFNQVTGKQDVLEQNVEYEVGTPGGASVALDKMNVLYIGVDNPLTIASSTGWDKTKVGITGGGGSLVSTGGAGHYNARVTAQTDECYVTVNADNKTSQFKFRVRNVPPPVATVGGPKSGDNIPAATFKAQGGVAAWIENFPFDLKYTVTSFVISTDSDEGEIVEARVQGNAFDAKALNLIRTQVKAGKTVYIDDIRVAFPDGTNKKVPSLVYYIK